MAVKALISNHWTGKEFPESLIWNNDSSILDLKALALRIHCLVFVISTAVTLDVESEIT